METLETIKRRLDTASDLGSIVRTMKALAMVNLRGIEAAVASLADYERTVRLGLRALARRGRLHPTARQTETPRTTGAVVFGSDQGMCGSLNDQAVALALKETSEFDIAASEFTAIGERPAVRLTDAGHRPKRVFATPSSVSGVGMLVQDLLVWIEAWRPDRVLLFFCARHQRSTYRPRMTVLLPLDVSRLTADVHEPWPGRTLPAWTMADAELLASLARQHLFVSLYRAMAESIASENIARLAAMRGAESNIEERIRDLTALFHRQRQQVITEELLDIVSGFEAQREPNDREFG